MSDWIEHSGKKYFEEAYLEQANEAARRARQHAARLREALSNPAVIFETEYAESFALEVLAETPAQSLEAIRAEAGANEEQRWRTMLDAITRDKAWDCLNREPGPNARVILALCDAIRAEAKREERAALAEEIERIEMPPNLEGPAVGAWISARNYAAHIVRTFGLKGTKGSADEACASS